MSNSLSDQLLKLGLVDEKKAKQSAHDKRVKKTKKKKSKEPAGPSTEALTAQAHAQLLAEKAEKDQALEAERKTIRERAERLAQARDIVKSQGMPSKGEDKKYRFTHNKKIKEFWVSNADFERLAKGLVGVVQMDKRWYLIEPEAYVQVIERAPDLLAFKAQAAEQDPDDPYADFQIPDDLDW